MFLKSRFIKNKIQERIKIYKQKRVRSGDPAPFNYILHGLIEWPSGRCRWTVTFIESIKSTVIIKVWQTYIKYWWIIICILKKIMLIVYVS